MTLIRQRYAHDTPTIRYRDENAEQARRRALDEDDDLVLPPLSLLSDPNALSGASTPLPLSRPLLGDADDILLMYDDDVKLKPASNSNSNQGGRRREMEDAMEGVEQEGEEEEGEEGEERETATTPLRQNTKKKVLEEGEEEA